MLSRPRAFTLPDVFLGALAVSSGALTPGQLRRRSLVVPVLRGVYRPTTVPLTHGLKCRAAGLVVGHGARLTGTSLLTALGTPLVRPDDPVTMVVIGDEASRVRGIDVRRVVTGPLGSATWYDVPVADQERMALDLTIGRTLEDAVAHLYAAAHAGHLQIGAFTAWLAGRHDAGVVRAKEAAALADGRAESPPESIMRVRLLAAGLPVVPQVEVRDSRGFAGRVDLAIEHLRLAIEYDGAWHGDGRQVARDRERLNRLREAGWVVVHVTAATLKRRGELEAAVLSEVARLSARR